MKAWVARHKDDGTISVYAQKPILIEDMDMENGEEFSYFSAAENDDEFLEAFMGDDFHGEVTAENSPMCIDLTDKDMLYILKHRSNKNEEWLQRNSEAADDYMPISVVALVMGESYVINHLIRLLEANIAEQKGGGR